MLNRIETTGIRQPSFGTRLVITKGCQEDFARTTDEFKKGFHQAEEELKKDGDNKAEFELSLGKKGINLATYKKNEDGMVVLPNLKLAGNITKATEIKDFIVSLYQAAKSNFDKWYTPKKKFLQNY